MDGMEVMDSVEEVEQPIETGEIEATATETPTTEVQEAEDPYSQKTSKAYSDWLKSVKDATPEASKYARIAKDDHARLYQLNQLEPKGLEGVREKYALLDSVVHVDPERGELKGADAIGAIQDELRNVEEIDGMLFEGKPEALDMLGDGFKDGLAKLTPHILDRVQASHPEEYAEAIFPHLMRELYASPLTNFYNQMVDIANEQMPKWLPQDKVGAWMEDRNQRLFSQLRGMNAWYKAQDDKLSGAQNGKNGTVPRGNGTKPTQNGDNPEARAEKVLQQHHWQTNIAPGLDKHADTRFQELFRPFEKRLRLDGPTLDGLKQEFARRVASQAAKPGQGNRPNAYMQQIARYQVQKNPDPATVVNFAKVEFDKHASQVLQSIINERYKPFLNGKPQAAPGQRSTNGQFQPKAPVSPGIQAVSVRPQEDLIDHKNRSLDQIHKKIFPLKNGKIVQLVR